MKVQKKFDGQDSDNMGAKNDLVGQTLEQRDPYRVSGGDFKDGHAVSAAHGQSTGAEKLNNETAEKNQLAMYAINQEGPRHIEDGGVDMPVGDRAAAVSKNFKVSVNQGESGSASPSKVSIMESVSLSKGYIQCSGNRTRVQEVPEEKVSIAGPVAKFPKAGLQGKNK